MIRNVKRKTEISFCVIGQNSDSPLRYALYKISSPIDNGLLYVPKITYESTTIVNGNRRRTSKYQIRFKNKCAGSIYLQIGICHE